MCRRIVGRDGYFMSNNPTNPISKLIAACSKYCSKTNKCVRVNMGESTTPEYFNINGGQSEIIQRIGNKLLEDLEYKPPSKPFNKWKHPSPKPMIDAYTFTTGFKHGYIAYFYNKAQNIWVIKSFKKAYSAPIVHNMEIDLSKISIKETDKESK